ncbi:hypothetical protein CGMCC3_g12958 [Colletotrichum fructicola]|nr:uncharacterized protein CGMCC3_g12958 [Colletotrichum fructicola]KAE9570982.1 hypothetical protein CGMCC3_g12958 [Colletotrichum fructicola]KAF4881283.1 hypothetical protein CGCFRS4_v015710 [Colletotrichum fructicola]
MRALHRLRAGRPSNVAHQIALATQGTVMGHATGRPGGKRFFTLPATNGEKADASRHRFATNSVLSSSVSFSPSKPSTFVVYPYSPQPTGPRGGFLRPASPFSATDKSVPLAASAY